MPAPARKPKPKSTPLPPAARKPGEGPVKVYVALKDLPEIRALAGDKLLDDGSDDRVAIMHHTYRDALTPRLRKALRLLGEPTPNVDDEGPLAYAYRATRRSGAIQVGETVIVSNGAIAVLRPDEKAIAKFYASAVKGGAELLYTFRMPGGKEGA
ncbi:MAG: hypothetical protein WEE89_00760 [Gemmatimonadota bacterium]